MSKMRTIFSILSAFFSMLATGLAQEKELIFSVSGKEIICKGNIGKERNFSYLADYAGSEFFLFFEGEKQFYSANETFFISSGKDSLTVTAVNYLPALSMKNTFTILAVYSDFYTVKNGKISRERTYNQELTQIEPHCVEENFLQIKQKYFNQNKKRKLNSILWADIGKLFLLALNKKKLQRTFSL